MSDHKKEIDHVTGVETTGHEWDGLKELNNPLPRWWVWVWVVTIIWAVGYWVVYPAWPTLSGHTKGTFGWTQYKELEASQAEIFARQSQYLDKFQAASYDQISGDPELYAFAQAGGRALFKNNCALCHGSGAEGSKGYPNLNDDDWLWGGTLADIEHTIRYGIRSSHDEARVSQMPSFGKDAMLEKEEIEKVVDYVLSLSSDEGSAAYAEGAEIFANNCASCHGEDAKGGRDFGAPNLSDAIWLYGGEHEDVYQSVFNAHAGVMPNWEGKLDDNSIRQLTLYVHSLGGGEGVGSAVVEEVSQEEPVLESSPDASEPSQDSVVKETSIDASAEPSVEGVPVATEAATDEPADK